MKARWPRLHSGYYKCTSFKRKEVCQTILAVYWASMQSLLCGQAHASLQLPQQTQKPVNSHIYTFQYNACLDPFLTRRTLLAGVVAVTAGLSFSTPADALGLHSAASAKRAVLTFQNSLGRTVKIYWVSWASPYLHVCSFFL